MKKGLRVLCLLLVSLMLTGCYKVDTTMTINSDKSGKVGYIFAFDKEVMKSMMGEPDGEPNGEDMIDVDDYEELKDKGWDVEAYKEKNDEHDWQGVKLTKKVDSIDNYLATSLDELVLFGDGTGEADTVDFDKLFVKSGDVYSAKYVFDISSSDSDSDSSGFDASAMESMFDLRFVVNLPNKSESNNATNVSSNGKTLTWDLKYSEPTSIEFSFKVEPASMLLPIIIGVVAVVVILAVVCCVVLSKKKKAAVVEE